MPVVGSAGDVHPFTGLGKALHKRGHEVTILTAGKFQKTVEDAGLRFVATGTAEEFDEATENPDLWHPRKGIMVVMQTITEHLRRLYDLIAQHDQPGRTLMVCHPLAFSARVYEDKHDTPSVTIHLAPSSIRTHHMIPAFAPGKSVSNLPMWLKNIAWWLVDHRMFDRFLEKDLNRLRAELDLPPVSRAFAGWINSPNKIIGLFPEWFGPVQPDWPRQLSLTGFPRYDEADQHDLDPALCAWLDTNDKPIAIAPGSANAHGDDFVREAIDAIGRLNKRALVLTRYPQILPDPLPDHAMHVDYAPFSEVFPQCAAVIHHGGIGTCAQGLAAGVPQLIMPMGFDQPDNVTRLMQLGVGDGIVRSKFKATRVADTLSRLLNDNRVNNAASRYAEQVASDPTLDTAAQIAEAAFHKQPSH